VEQERQALERREHGRDHDYGYCNDCRRKMAELHDDLRR
jgi:hypothetical protein